MMILRFLFKVLSKKWSTHVSAHLKCKQFWYLGFTCLTVIAEMFYDRGVLKRGLTVFLCLQKIFGNSFLSFPELICEVVFVFEIFSCCKKCREREKLVLQKRERQDRVRYKTERQKKIYRNSASAFH